MGSLSFHGVMVAALPGTSQLLTQWPPLIWVCHPLVQPQQLKRRPNAKKINILTLHAIFIYFPSPLRRSVLYINQVGADFISALGHRISTHTDDPRETSFLFQRLSVTIQHFNAVCFANSFGNFEVEVRRNQPRHTYSSCFFHSFIISKGPLEWSTGGW